MPNWKLTHMAEETSLQTGQTNFFLVFDDGACRVPVTEDVLKMVLKQLAEAPRGNGSAVSHLNIPTFDVVEGVTDDSDAEQF